VQQNVTITKPATHFHRDILRAIAPDNGELRFTREGARYHLDTRTARQASVTAPSVTIAAWLISKTLRERFNLGPAPRVTGEKIFIYPDLGRLPAVITDAIGWRDIRLTLFGAETHAIHDCAFFTLEDLHADGPRHVADTWAPCRQVALWDMSDTLLAYLENNC
jgi:hypothetical protein